MKPLSNGDVYADALSTAAIATIPFITLGKIGHPATLYVAVSLGILFACCYFGRIIFMMVKDSPARTSRKLENLMGLLEVPYVIALSALIFIHAGYEVEAALWIALGAAIAAVVFILLDNTEY